MFSLRPQVAALDHRKPTFNTWFGPPLSPPPAPKVFHPAGPAHVDVLPASLMWPWEWENITQGWALVGVG